MTPTLTAHETATAGPQKLWQQTVYAWITTVDHKRIGLLYIGYAMLFLLIGGFEAMLIRIQLAVPNNHFVTPEVFNRMFTMHGTTMVFFVGMPILFGFGNYLVPLMIGARDMAFPRLNAFSFWISAFGGLLLYYSFIGGDGLYGAGTAPDVGWFAYAPLTATLFSPGHSTDYWIRGHLSERHRQCGHGAQPGGHHRLPALQGHDHGADAAAGVALPGHLGAGLHRHRTADRGADHAAAGPLPRVALFRRAGGRIGRVVDALFLDLRPP